jgi:methyl-accepting chemotaxis protein
MTKSLERELTMLIESIGQTIKEIRDNQREVLNAVEVIENRIADLEKRTDSVLIELN